MLATPYQITTGLLHDAVLARVERCELDMSARLLTSERLLRVMVVLPAAA